MTLNSLLLYLVINGVCSTDEGKQLETSQNRTRSEHMHLTVQCLELPTVLLCTYLTLLYREKLMVLDP